jgi:hypothetical protein
MKQPVYCWSLNGEEFHGEFDTREAALSEAQAEAENDWPYGHTGTVYTGEQRHALHFLRKREARIGESVVEQLDEWLIDDIASDDIIVELIKEKHAAFGKHILDWLEVHGSFNRWAVDAVQEHEFTTPEEGRAEV